MNTRHLLVLAILAAACGGGSSGSPDAQPADGRTNDGSADVADAVEAAPDIPDAAPEVEPPYPVPADPLPTPDSGTYSWTDGTNKLSFALNDGMVFVLEASFECIGTTGCKVKQEFAKLTCNTAWEKGYHGDLVDGTFTVQGIKSSDTLFGALQTATTIDAVYELTPKVSCCQKKFFLTAQWTLKDDCAEYAVPDCDLYTDADCEEGLNCIIGIAGKPICIVEGETPVGDPCQQQTSCSDGVCTMMQGDKEMHCYQYCKTDADCGWGLNCMTITGEKYKLCSLPSSQYEKCDLLLQNCTNGEDACYLQASAAGYPVCMKEGTGAQGDPCTTSLDCAQGLECVSGQTCMKLCNTQGGEPKCDDVFTNCAKYYEYQHAGYCGK